MGAFSLPSRCPSDRSADPTLSNFPPSVSNRNHLTIVGFDDIDIEKILQPKICLLSNLLLDLFPSLFVEEILVRTMRANALPVSLNQFYGNGADRTFLHPGSRMA